MGITRPTRLLAAAGTVATLALAVSACAGSGSVAGTDKSTPAGGTSTADPKVAALTKPLDAYPLPTDSVDVSGLKGKTLYYIPITLQAPQFSITQKALTAAAAAVGAKVQVCDGKGAPDSISACVKQATNAKAAAIIGDAFPYVLAANALNAAQKAGIPVINGNQIPLGVPAGKTLAYVGGNAGSDMESALATWMVSDSGGKAQILENLNADGPVPAEFQKAGQKVIDACSGCKLTINKVSSGNFPLVAPSTSSALLKDPSITYVESQYEQFLQPTQGGIQQASKSGVKVVSGATQLSGLKAVAGGGLAAASSQAAAYEGWVFLDAAARMTTGATVPEYTIPVRLFTKDTMSDVKLTDAAEASGEWYGPATFTDGFKKLWGLA